jgi:putative FmdB family regulatory protein
MPIYEYVCSKCNSSFELLRSLSQSDNHVDCPRCHSPARRKMSTFACFSVSGSGAPKRIAGTGGSCSGCSSDSCSTCGS